MKTTQQLLNCYLPTRQSPVCLENRQPWQNQDGKHHSKQHQATTNTNGVSFWGRKNGTGLPIVSAGKRKAEDWTAETWKTLDTGRGRKGETDWNLRSGRVDLSSFWGGTVDGEGSAHPCRYREFVVGGWSLSKSVCSC